MAWYQGNDLRKPTGGKKARHRKKRKHELGRPPTMTRFSVKEVRKIIRVRGGNLKIRLKRVTYVNVAVPNERKVAKTRILEVVETPSNPQYARGNYITRGTIVKTELGLVKITSRPGQDGVLNGILIEKQ
ncbi:30S ribosomal protein S8e [Staphylothermus hellenicus]|uniref:Small ribosomal subunit protein eS8 n=1 Tax=Staphylothermus hellenicus (strain DSM 12710 / JCM 10830 / BK20S6-10-b1 / P8) TaxID=591019 RepID=D7D960_STAHD|nr:30S ribosomal protein S8e [Staphylothermus hellenicus]ADI32306.1 ribosomal protein S8e [Staphylothermus hellenicus DSM 12710]